MRTNDIADAFDNYIHHALDRTIATHEASASVGRQQGPKWYDRELRLKRSVAINAGEYNSMVSCQKGYLRIYRERVMGK